MCSFTSRTCPGTSDGKRHERKRGDIAPGKALKLVGDTLPANQTPPNGRRLESWKEISAYLNREVRTAMRWEKERGLPVHRIPGKRSGVYALSSEVEAWLKAESASNGDGLAEVVPSAPLGSSGRPALWLIVVATTSTLGIAAMLLVASAMQPRLPHLRNQVAVTNDGLIKGGLFPAGRTLYFANGDGERWTLMRTPGRGAPPSPVYYSPSLGPLDISGDGAEILAASSDCSSCPCSLGLLRRAGGPFRKLVDRPVDGAAWSPDGTMLAYARGSDLYLARPDGTMPRKLATMRLTIDTPRWSPDGKRLRLATWDRDVGGVSSRLWDVELDRAVARQVLPGWSRAPRDHERRGRWTPDGSFFIFDGVHDGVPGLFAIQERRPFYASASPTPIRLTTNGDGVSDPTPSPDGKKIFAIVQSHPRGELIRYELKAGQFVIWPDMTGLSAGQVAFSRDGRQAAYVSYPDLNLWKMNADGTGKRQLTFGESKAAMPRWSPDGRRIAFMGWTPGNDISKIGIIPADGGVPDQPVTWPGWQGIPTWTADGTGLIFGENGHFNPIPASCTIHRFDFRTGQTYDLPGTTGLWTARACPTGRYIAATTRDQGKLVLYDMQTAAVTDLVRFPESKVGDNPTWSTDGKFIYIDAPLGPNPAIYRIRIADKHKERVASLKDIQRAAGGIDHWIGLTPDGSPLVMRRVQGSEIYAWDWVAP
jgi:eukaryotic-like serine/threonine-protein kinase